LTGIPCSLNLGRLEQLVNAAETNPLEIFEEQFWTQNYIEFLCKQSRNYTHQKGFPCSNANAKNMKVFLAILILLGYNKVPHRRLLE
jgi:hypothetical protein